MSASTGLQTPPRRPASARRTTPARLVAWLAAAALAAACGGGKKSDGFEVDPAELTFTAGEQDALPATQVIRLTVTNPAAAYLGAAFLDDTPGWIAVGTPSGAGASWTIPISATTTALAPGPHVATLTVGIADVNDQLLATREVRITYAVSARLRASTPALAFTAVETGAQPAAQSLGILGTGIAWTATADAPWIQLSAGSGVGPASVSVGVSQAALAPGLHQGLVTIQAAGGGAVVQVAVSLQVEPARLTVSQAQLPFAGVNGTAIAPARLDVALNSRGVTTWTATATAPWIRLGPASGSTPDSLLVSVDPAAAGLASGQHAGAVHLSAPLGDRTLTATVQVALTLTRPVLTATPASLALGGPTGRDLTGKPVSLSLSTGGSAFAFTASPSRAWLQSSAQAGNVSGTPVQLTVGADAAGLAGGRHAAALDFAVAVNGDLITASVPVTLDIDDRRLLVSDTGVAFARTPSLASLTRTLTVRDNFGVATAWLAAADQPWLTVTASGTAPGDLTLTADPAGLAADALHEASVTITAAVTDGRPPEVVKVGLWIGSADPAPTTTLYYSGFSSLALDPVRPYAYVHSRGSAITVYNVFTEQVVATMQAVGAALGDMTVSNDGATLFVTDRTNYRVVPVALATRTKGTPFPVGAPVGPTLHYARTNGRGLVLTGNGCVFDAATGAVAWPAGGCTGTDWAAVTASLRGNIWAVDSLTRSLDATAAGGGAVLVGDYRFPNVTAWNTADYAFDQDGTRMYLAVKAPYDFYVADCTGSAQSMPQVQTLPGNAYPNNVEVARDGRVFAGNTGYGKNAWIYAPDGTQLRSWEMAYIGLMDRMLKVSGDGLRLVAIVETGGGSPTGLTFTTVAP